MYVCMHACIVYIHVCSYVCMFSDFKNAVIRYCSPIGLQHEQLYFGELMYKTPPLNWLFIMVDCDISYLCAPLTPV